MPTREGPDYNLTVSVCLVRVNELSKSNREFFQKVESLERVKTSRL